MDQLDWVSMFKRYVGNDIKTPYFVPVGRLTRVQARNEFFVYTLFMGVLFVAFGVAGLSPALPHGDTLGVSLYAFLVVGAAVAFAFSKHPAAAAVLASAPVAVLIYFAVFGFHPNAGTGDKVFQVIIALLWLRYSWRILQITRAWPTMRERDAPERDE
jgi:hypothetical protein